MRCKLAVLVLCVLLTTSCSLLPSLGAGARLANSMAENQKAFQEAILSGAVSIDCATGFTVGARIAYTSNAKIDLAKANLLSVTDQKSDSFMKCYKFGLYAAFTEAEAEWTVQRLLEFLGTIN